MNSAANALSLKLRRRRKNDLRNVLVTSRRSTKTAAGMSSSSSSPPSSSHSSLLLPLLQRAARLIAQAERVVVLTGAGISEESGIPTYRGVILNNTSTNVKSSRKPPLWEPTSSTNDGTTTTAAAVATLRNKLGTILFGTKLGWLLFPTKAWELYVDRLLRPILLAQPNPAHRALVELENLRRNQRTQRQRQVQKLSSSDDDDLPIITQNVDGLHKDAGNTNVYEIHGTTKIHRCTWNQNQIIPVDKQSVIQSNQLPKESSCCWFGGIRPQVVLFGESIPFHIWSEAYEKVEALRENDVLLVIGTSCQVQPVSCLPQVALERGATVIEINTSSQPQIQRQLVYYMHDGDHNITASSTRWVPPHQLLHLGGSKAGIILPQLVKLVKDQMDDT